MNDRTFLRLTWAALVVAACVYVVVPAPLMPRRGALFALCVVLVLAYLYASYRTRAERVYTVVGLPGDAGTVSIVGPAAAPCMTVAIAAKTPDEAVRAAHARGMGIVAGVFHGRLPAAESHGDPASRT